MSAFGDSRIAVGTFNNSFKVSIDGESGSCSNGILFDSLSGNSYFINFDEVELDDVSDGVYLCIKKEAPFLRCTGVSVLTKTQAQSEQEKNDCLYEFCRIDKSRINNDIVYINDSLGYLDYLGAYLEPDFSESEIYDSQPFVRYTSGSINGYGVLDSKRTSLIKVPDSYNKEVVFGFSANANDESAEPSFQDIEDPIDSFFPVAVFDLEERSVTRLSRKNAENRTFNFE